MAGPASVQITCSSCAAVLPAQAKFCLECGAPVVADPGREVRKTVTLVFTDVTGSTAMGEVLDPEAYRGIMGRYFEVARAAVERHGGTVEKFVGDAVLAVFGVPDVREDDALRAVRAADELRRAVGELSEEVSAQHGVALAIRTGVNTGSVVAGTARAGGSFATGDAVNTAARLEQAAGAGEVLLGHETYRLVRDAVDVLPVEPVTAKGKAEPVAAYRLLRVRADAAGRARQLDAPLVGRAHEMRALDDALERTLTTGRSHLVTVVGDPGVGKTRLVTELLRRVGDRAEVLSGRCVSYGQGITFFPVVQVIRSAARLGGGESPEVVRHALAGVMAGATDADDVVDLLLPLLGVGDTPGNHDQTSWAVRRLVEQLALRRPLVVTVDDLHWAEPSLLELLDRLRVELADLPFLLVCGARPELLDAHPEWGHGALNSTTFALEPFDADQVAARVQALLGGEVSPAVTRTVGDWSGGNPLFVEEIVTHLREEGRIVRDAENWHLPGDLMGLATPPSIAALLAARLDRLPAPERDLLGRVSVVGQEFTTAEAQRLVEPSARSGLPHALTGLVRRDLLRRVRGPAGDSWAFRHLMVRDAAYDSLPKALRARLHEAFADALTEDVAVVEAGVDTGAERRAFVGHHLEVAVRLRRELAPHDPLLPTLTGRAAEALAEAAREARRREDGPAAVHLLRRALALDLPASRRRDLLVQLLACVHLQFRVHDIEAATRELAAATPPGSGELDEVTLAHQRLLTRLLSGADTDPAEMRAASERLETLARAADDDARLELALYGLVNVCALNADMRAMRDLVESLERERFSWPATFDRLTRVAIVVNGEVPFGLAAELVGKAFRDHAVTPVEVLWRDVCASLSRSATDPRGAHDLALGLIARLPGTVDNEMMVRSTLGELFRVLGDLDRAVEWLERGVAGMVENGDHAHASTYVALQALAMLDRGDPSDEVRSLVEAARAWTSSHDVKSLGLVNGLECALASRAGDLQAAGPHAERALAAAAPSGSPLDQADVRRLVAEWPRAAGDTGLERRLLAEAAELYRVKQVPVWLEVCERRLRELG